MTEDITKDEALLNAITSEKAVLFLGSGALAESVLKNGNKSPLGNGLAELVFNHFYKDEQYEWETLQQVSSNIHAKYGKKKLHEYLNSIFEGINPSRGIQRITEFKWSKIYTTNIDKAIETAYQRSSNKAKDIVSVIGSGDISASDPRTQTTLYKLHGCVSRPDVDLVFSLEEYAEYKDSHLKLFNQLSIDLVDSPVIFIGYSLIDSNFQSTLSTIKKYCSTTTKKNQYFFVGPNIKQSLADYLDANGFIYYNLGIEDFMEHLSNLTAGKRTTLKDYFIEHTLNIDLFIKGELDEKEAYNLSKEYEFPSVELSKHVTKNTYFYKGSYPSWGDIKHELDGKREILEDLILSFELWYNNPKFGFWLVTGASGDGKSTLMKRFAAEISSRIGNHILFAKSRSRLDPVELENLQRSVSKPLVLFIDNITDRETKVNQLIDRFRKNKVNILIIGATRTSDWYANLNHFYFKPVEFSLDRLSDIEINNVLNRLEVHDSLGSLIDKTHEQRFETFKDHSDRELIVAMCEATSGLSLEEIIANEYTGLKSELAKIAYLHICLINQLRYRIPQSLFLRVLRLNFTTVKNEVFDLTKNVIFSDEADETDYLLRSRHSVIAEVVSKYYFKDDIKKIEYLTAIFREHVPSNPLEASLIKKLYHHSTIKLLFSKIEIGVSCYDQLAREIPDNAYLLQQKALFLVNNTDNYLESIETIKEAIRLNPTSGILHHTHGTILMKLAIEEKDKDKSIYYLEEGKRTLLIGARLNSNNVYNYHTVISYLIKWYKIKGEDDNNQILEIQELVDEASNLHPNDSLILTEHGKLHELLKDAEKSKIYFEKSLLINPGNSSARYLLAKILIEDGQKKMALKLCDEGVKIKKVEVQVHRLRFELIHSINELSHHEIVREYEDYLHESKKDSFIKLCYAAYLYSLGDNRCDRIFIDLKQSEIMSFQEKLRVSPEINRIINNVGPIERATVLAVKAAGYFLRSERFNSKTPIFLLGNKMQGLRRGDIVEYQVNFNYLGPIAENPKRIVT